MIVAAMILGTLCFRRRDFGRAGMYLLFAWVIVFIQDVVYDILDIIHRDWPGLGLSLGLTAFAAWMLWNKWRGWKDRRKVMDALGAKSRALRDKLVEKMREGRQPSPVRIPS